MNQLLIKIKILLPGQDLILSKCPPTVTSVNAGLKISLVVMSSSSSSGLEAVTTVTNSWLFWTMTRTKSRSAKHTPSEPESERELDRNKDTSYKERKSVF